MMVFFVITMLIVVIPTLHLINSKYVQRLALIIGASQLALLAFSGKIDKQLSGFLVNAFNHTLSFSCHTIIHKIYCLFFTY